jgi:hypothetical protein
MYESNVSPFVFIIDTNKYAGNFERELCAFCTGIVGDCGVGEEYGRTFLEEEFGYEDADNPMEERIAPIVCDDGCRRPTSIWQDPKGKGYDSVAIFFYEAPTKKEIDLIKRRAEKFATNYEKNKCERYGIEYNKKEDLKIKGFRLLEQEVIRREISI